MTTPITDPTAPDDIAARAQTLPPHEQLADILDELRRRWRKADNRSAMDELDLTAAELTELLRAEMPDHADALTSLLHYSTAAGVLLGKLAATYPTLVKRRVVTGITRWSIYPAGWGSFSLEREGVDTTGW